MSYLDHLEKLSPQYALIPASKIFGHDDVVCEHCKETGNVFYFGNETLSVIGAFRKHKNLREKYPQFLDKTGKPKVAACEALKFGSTWASLWEWDTVPDDLKPIYADVVRTFPAYHKECGMKNWIPTVKTGLPRTPCPRCGGVHDTGIPGSVKINIKSQKGKVPVSIALENYADDIDWSIYADKMFSTKDEMLLNCVAHRHCQHMASTTTKPKLDTNFIVMADDDRVVVYYNDRMFGDSVEQHDLFVKGGELHQKYPDFEVDSKTKKIKPPSGVSETAYSNYVIAQFMKTAHGEFICDRPRKGIMYNNPLSSTRDCANIHFPVTYKSLCGVISHDLETQKSLPYRLRKHENWEDQSYPPIMTKRIHKLLSLADLNADQWDALIIASDDVLSSSSRIDAIQNKIKSILDTFEVPDNIVELLPEYGTSEHVFLCLMTSTEEEILFGKEESDD